MEINSANLRTLYTSFSTAFQGSFGAVQPQYRSVAMVVPSSTKTQEYGWLKDLPGIRKWIGDRVVNNLASGDYKIKNEPYEFTVGVDADDIEDDNIGIYGPMFQMIGDQAAKFADTQVWPFLKAGNSTLCYDGQSFFDSDHPVLDEEGVVQSVSNYGGGAGDFWCLAVTSLPFKPVIWQVRKDLSNIIRMDAQTDEVVFNRKEYRYGIDGRMNCGFGFWQLCYGSRQTLNATSYAAARAAIASFKRDYGQPLGLMPDTLFCSPSNEGPARKVLVNDRDDAGASNEWAGTAKVQIVPWLA